MLNIEKGTFDLGKVSEQIFFTRWIFLWVKMDPVLLFLPRLKFYTRSIFPRECLTRRFMSNQYSRLSGGEGAGVYSRGKSMPKHWNNLYSSIRIWGDFVMIVC